MAIFGWFNKNNADREAEPESSGLSRIDSTRPVAGSREAKDLPAGNAQPANRKSERMARRELLYGVVRETMTRAGVLSSSYKFKVLSLDARARQFLVMVDLAPVQGIDAPRFGEVEAMIAQSAKNRYDIVVTAVYWRMHDHVAVGSMAIAPAAPIERPPASAITLPGVHARVPPAAAAAGAGPATTPPTLAPAVAPAVASVPGGVSPKPARTNAEEVAEFRRALAAGLTRPAGAAVAAAAGVASGGASAVAVRSAVGHVAAAPARSFEGAEVRGPQNYTLLTGFEDTELGDNKVKLRSLSGSQFGDLN